MRKSCGAIFLIFSCLFFKNCTLFICTIYFLKFYRPFFERKNKKKEILYMWLPAVGTLFSGAFCAVCASRAFLRVLVSKILYRRFKGERGIFTNPQKIRSRVPRAYNKSRPCGIGSAELPSSLNSIAHTFHLWTFYVAVAHISMLCSIIKKHCSAVVRLVSKDFLQLTQKLI